jgi:GT2 family glycosyltransferase
VRGIGDAGEVADSAGRPQLTVVLSTLGNYEVLSQVLDGYSRQEVPRGTFEMLVVSDLAEPDPEAVDTAIGERPYRVRRLTPSVPGLSANRNVGWQAARTPIVLFTDNDTIPVSGLVSEHLAWHQRYPDPETVVVGWVRWARGIKVTPFMTWLDHGYQFDFHSIEGADASWAHVYGANSSIKREFLVRVGGYDEERLPYLYEDLDWGYRARDHGLRVMLNRRAIVDHLGATTLPQWQLRAPRLAAAEWTFCQLHPDIPPWFHEKFSQAAALPAQSPLASNLAHLVPRRTPILGRRLWRRADLYWRQQIAPNFLATWDALAAGGTPPQPPVSTLIDRASSSPGR